MFPRKKMYVKGTGHKMEAVLNVHVTILPKALCREQKKKKKNTHTHKAPHCDTIKQIIRVETKLLLTFSNLFFFFSHAAKLAIN